MKALQHQHAKFQDHIRRWPTSLDTRPATRGTFEDRAEYLEVHRRVQDLKRIAFSQDLGKVILSAPKPSDGVDAPDGIYRAKVVGV